MPQFEIRVLPTGGQISSLISTAHWIAKEDTNRDVSLNILFMINDKRSLLLVLFSAVFCRQQ